MGVVERPDHQAAELLDAGFLAQILLDTFPGSVLVSSRYCEATPETPAEAAASDAEKAAAVRRIAAWERRQEVLAAVDAPVEPAALRDHDLDVWRMWQGMRPRYAPWYEANWGPAEGRDTSYVAMLPVSLTSRRLHEQGWCWYPQDRSTRHPMCGSSPKLAKLGTYGPLDARGHDVVRTSRQGKPYIVHKAGWIDRLRTGLSANVAVPMGGRDRLWTVDVDIDDAALAARVERLAVEELGATPFVRRRLSSNRVALVYRSDYVLRIAKMRMRDGIGDVEILGEGASLTILGRHHKTDDVFLWDRLIPGLDEGATPQAAPVVDEATFARFLARLREEFADDLAPLQRRSREGVVLQPGRRNTTMRTYVEANPPSDAAKFENGKRVDGREEWLWEHCEGIARLNPDATYEDVAAEVRLLADATLQYGGRFTAATIDDAILSRAKRAVSYGEGKRRDGTAVPVKTHVLPDGREVVTADATDTPADVADPEVAVLLQRDPTWKLQWPRTAPDEAAKQARALMTDRTTVTAPVTRTVDDTCRDWFDGIRRAAKDEDIVAPSYLLQAPTGAGKTSRFVGIAAELKRERRFVGPVLLTLPAYGLIEEVVGRIEDDRKAEVERMADAVAEAERAGLRVMVYQGKGRTCLKKEIYDLLAARAMSTTNMCERTTRMRDANGKWISHVQSCVHKVDDTCPYWSQRRRIAESDLVLLPSAYLTLPVPVELKQCRGLAIDESVVGNVMGSAHLTPSTLDIYRREPRLTKRDKAGGLIAEELVAARRDVAAWARQAIVLGRPIPEHIAAQAAAAKVDAVELVTHAINIVGRALDAHAKVSPSLTVEGAQFIAGEAAMDCDAQLWAEHRFWSVVRERIEALKAGNAKGTHDLRLQVLDPGTERESIRISWRRPTSFDMPLLLMDASADERLVRKFWPDRDVETRRVDCPPHARVVWIANRTASDSSLLPYVHQATVDAVAAATHLVSLQDLVEGLATRYADTQVLVGLTKKVEVALLTDWAEPRNVATLHYGAERGLDFAKNWSVGVFGGRPEPSIRAMDAGTAALSYDDEHPELPIDRYGTGLDARGKPIRCPMSSRVIRMRDGSDVTAPLPIYEGAWAQILQRQAREEAVSQMMGRHRLTHRDGEAPLLFYYGRSLPEQFVVDAVTSLEDLVKGLSVDLTAARLLGGLLPAEDTGIRPGLASMLGVQADRPEVRNLSGARFRALRRVAWTTGDGTERNGHVLSNLSDEDVEARVTAWEADRGRVVLGPVRELLRARPDDGTRPRPLDARMQALVGTREDRVAAQAASVARRDRDLDAAWAKWKADLERWQAEVAAAKAANRMAPANAPANPWRGVDARVHAAVLGGCARSEADPANVARPAVIEAIVAETVPEAAQTVSPANSYEAMLDEAAELFAA